MVSGAGWNRSCDCGTSDAVDVFVPINYVEEAVVSGAEGPLALRNSAFILFIEPSTGRISG